MQAFFFFFFAVLLMSVVAGYSITSKSQINAIVSKHNQLRRGMGASDMMELEWDSTLARGAQTHINACYWGHSHGSGYGENLASKYDSTVTSITSSTKFSSDIQGWYSEIKDAGGCKSGGTYGSRCGSGTGHYTQVVWADANKIGCGAAMCKGWIYLECRYGTSVSGGYPGNMQGATLFTRGSKCSKCPSGSSCNSGLCSLGGSSSTSSRRRGSSSSRRRGSSSSSGSSSSRRRGSSSSRRRGGSSSTSPLASMRGKSSSTASTAYCKALGKSYSGYSSSTSNGKTTLKITCSGKRYTLRCAYTGSSVTSCQQSRLFEDEPIGWMASLGTVTAGVVAFVAGAFALVGVAFALRRRQQRDRPIADEPLMQVDIIDIDEAAELISSAE